MFVELKKILRERREGTEGGVHRAVISCEVELGRKENHVETERRKTEIRLT